MPKASGQNDFAKKIGEKGKKAFDAHKDDETIFSGGGDLPAGIEGGIAKLAEIKFDKVKAGKENAGEYYFYAAGIVVKPVEFEGMHVEGGRTSIMEMLCETPKRESRKTTEEHMEWTLNELRKLGLDTSELSLGDLESACSALVESDVYFKFRTWKGEKQTTGAYAGKEPRVQHQWNGKVDNYVPEDATAGAVEDNTGTASTETPAEVEDYAALATAAEAGDQDSVDKLVSYATAAGWTEEQISETPSWTALVESIAGGGAAEGAGEAAPAEDEWKPAVKEIYKYTPPAKGPGGKVMKGKKAFEAEVTKVDGKAKTVDLKNLDDGKTVYKAVAWDSLESAT